MILTKPHIHSLTGLRFFAALPIFYLHATNHDLFSSPILGLFDLSKSVSFFFVLSGFVLGYVYKDIRLNYLSFFTLRLARVWPLTFLSILVILKFFPTYVFLPGLVPGGPDGFHVFLINIFCIQSFFPIPSYYFGFNAVAWSVSTELFFYSLFPFLCNCRFSSLIRVLCFSVSASFLLALIAYFLGLPSYDISTIHLPVWQGLVYINPLSRLPEFLLGLITSRLFMTSSFYNYTLLFDLRKSYFSVFLFFELFILLILLFCGYFPISLFNAQPLQAFVSQIKSAICFSFVILIASNPRGLVGPILGCSPLQYLGKISFSFYLIHQPLLIQSAQLGGLHFFNMQLLPQNLYLLLLISIFFSSIAYFFVEMPIQKLIKSLS